MCVFFCVRRVCGPWCVSLFLPLRGCLPAFNPCVMRLPVGVFCVGVSACVYTLRVFLRVSLLCVSFYVYRFHVCLSLLL